MADDVIRLTYRELADRLDLSLDAAKMKARRAAKAGNWRLVPGNYPNAPVSVELPASAITPRATYPPEQKPEQAPITYGGDRDNNRADALLLALEQLTPLTERLMTANAEANARADALLADNRRLTDQLLDAKDKIASLSVELAATEARELGTAAELDAALRTVESLGHDRAHRDRPLWRRALGIK